MKYLFILSNCAFPAHDGKQHQIVQVIRHVCNAGHQVALIATARPGRPIDTTALQAEIPNLVSVTAFTVRPSYKTESLLRLAASAVSPLYRSPMIRAIHRAIESFQPDAAYCEGVVFAPLLKSLKGIPCFYNTLDVFSLRLRRLYHYEKHPVRKLLSLAGWGIACMLEQCAFRHATMLYAVSEGDKKEWQARSPGVRVRVIPTALTPPQCSPAEGAANNFRLLLMGDLQVRYLRDGMVWFFEKVWPAIKQKVPEASAWIVGGKYPANKRLIATLGNRQDVWLTSRVKNLDAAIVSSSVVCIPDPMGTGMKTRVINAMMLGKPVVGTSYGFESIPISDGCHGMIADSPEAFASACIQLLTDPALRQRIGNAGREFFTGHFNQERVASLWLRALNDIAISKSTAAKETP